MIQAQLFEPLLCNNVAQYHITVVPIIRPKRDREVAGLTKCRIIRKRLENGEGRNKSQI
jgi:hypothetical protein